MVYIPSPTNQRAQPAVALPQAQIIEITNGPDTPATVIPPAEVIVARSQCHASTSDTLTMEQFLALSWIDNDNANTRQLISRRMISHWTYFTLSTDNSSATLALRKGQHACCASVPSGPKLTCKYLHTLD
ncbi:hypothetical protein PCANC_26809 [Puccinia coronata f. sp. avenae]|uniref:Ig-like domain-containing protein n=1 Tax=Puccinia coronata f. sp. avenae TaxID=200324 RepID=A0A2N5RXV1_9BASI|nr:hypothetical protein PCANC_26809 [Puccinia coronata f. sp. avenae]